jgi:parvulin-like peptidyl-prolyl isomerase
LLESLVRFELIAMEAERKGYGKHDDVVLARKQAMVRQFTAQELGQLVKMSEIDDQQVQTYYEANAPEFNRPAQVRAAHILLANKADAEAVVRDLDAKNAKSSAERLKLFSDLARTRSTDAATKNQGGDLHFFGEPGVSKVMRGDAAPAITTAVARAAYAIEKAGDWTATPVKSSQGWHVVQKTAVRRAYKRELNVVKNKIRNKLFRKKKHEAMESFVAGLRTQAKIKIDDALVEQAKRKAGGPPPVNIEPPADLRKMLKAGGKR